MPARENNHFGNEFAVGNSIPPKHHHRLPWWRPAQYQVLLTINRSFSECDEDNFIFTYFPLRPWFFQVCPAGYNCGSGTDRSTQFAHKCPAGLFCSAGTEPDDQYESVCDAGYYCIRGTPNYLATQVSCLAMEERTH